MMDRNAFSISKHGLIYTAIVKRSQYEFMQTIIGDLPR
jgi:hypothetical protein